MSDTRIIGPELKAKIAELGDAVKKSVVWRESVLRARNERLEAAIREAVKRAGFGFTEQNEALMNLKSVLDEKQ